MLTLLVSLINTTTLAGALILLSIYYCWTDGSAGAVKALILITLRCILNPGLAATQEGITMIKWCLLFGLSFYAILAKPRNEKSGTGTFLLLLSFFSVYLIVGSFLVSSFPLVSIFKVISWAFIFGAVFYAVSGDTGTDWLGLLRLLLSGIMIFSVFTLPLDVGYLRNGTGFQGILNHPNMFGLMCALCFALNLTSFKKLTPGRSAMLLLCIGFSFLSQSRTSMFSIVILLGYGVLNSDMKLSEKIWAVLGLVVLVAMAVTIYVLNDPEGNGSISAFIYKAHDDDILYSRTSQIETLLDRFTAGPILGTGFMTPYYPGVRLFQFSFDLNVEPGNLILTVLAHTGIIGFLLFGAVYGYLFRFTPRGRRIIFLMPMILSLGEMAFFSSNNIAILYYVIFGACFAPEKKTETTENGKLQI